MFEDITEPTQDEMKETIADQRQIISDLENELIDREREIRDADKRKGEYCQMIDKMRELIRRYFDEHGKSIFEEWKKEEAEKDKPKVEVDLIHD